MKRNFFIKAKGYENNEIKKPKQKKKKLKLKCYEIEAKRDYCFTPGSVMTIYTGIRPDIESNEFFLVSPEKEMEKKQIYLLPAYKIIDGYCKEIKITLRCSNKKEVKIEKGTILANLFLLSTEELKRRHLKNTHPF